MRNEFLHDMDTNMFSPDMTKLNNNIILDNGPFRDEMATHLFEPLSPLDRPEFLSQSDNVVMPTSRRGWNNSKDSSVSKHNKRLQKDVNKFDERLDSYNERLSTRRDFAKTTKKPSLFSGIKARQSAKKFDEIAIPLNRSGSYNPAMMEWRAINQGSIEQNPNDFVAKMPYGVTDNAQMPQNDTVVARTPVSNKSSRSNSLLGDSSLLSTYGSAIMNTPAMNAPAVSNIAASSPAQATAMQKPIATKNAVASRPDDRYRDQARAKFFKFKLLTFGAIAFVCIILIVMSILAMNGVFTKEVPVTTPESSNTVVQSVQNMLASITNSTPTTAHISPVDSSQISSLVL